MNLPPKARLLVRYEMAAWRSDDHLGIHPKLPALERHRAARLPEPAHDRC
jgi:hypothetical protein